jgi:hypothetical protein
MTLNDLLAQIELLSDADKRILIDETIHMLSAEANGSSASKVIAEVAMADAYVVAPVVAEPKRETDEAYYAAIRARYEARQALLPVRPDQMMKRGMFKGRIPLDEELFRLAEWHPTEEELTGE